MGTEKYPKVAIIVLNYKGWQDTIECLESLQQIDYPDYQIVVVDNGSNDESVGKIKEWAEGRIEIDTEFVEYRPDLKPVFYIEYDKVTAERGGIEEKEEELSNYPPNRRIVIIENGQNLGFSGGNNVGIRYVLFNNMLPEYILLLNNDTIVEKKFLSNMVSQAEKESKVGIIGCKIYFLRDMQTLWYAGGKLTFFKPGGKAYGNGDIDNGQFNVKKYVTFVTGAAMLIKKRVIIDVGLFDENFFFGMEDYDFCRRALKRGYKLLYVPTSVIWHKVGRSREQIPSKIYMGYKTSVIYMKKHLPKLVWFFWFLVYYSYVFASSLKKIFTKKADKSYLKASLKGLKDGVVSDKVTEVDLYKFEKFSKIWKE